MSVWRRGAPPHRWGCRPSRRPWREAPHPQAKSQKERKKFPELHQVLGVNVDATKAETHLQDYKSPLQACVSMRVLHFLENLVKEETFVTDVMRSQWWIFLPMRDWKKWRIFLQTVVGPSSTFIKFSSSSKPKCENKARQTHVRRVSSL